MRQSNRPLLIFLAVLMLSVTAAASWWEQTALRPLPAETAAAPETTPAAAESLPPEETETPAPVRSGAPPPTAPPTPAPTATPTPVSALAGKLRITELMSKNRSTLRDEDGDFSDWIELTNVSDESVSLAGCRLADREGRYGWAFPEASLEPGERRVLFASRKTRDGEELHTNFALSCYDRVILYDAEGLVADSAACADTEADVALALDAAGAWTESLYPTPGRANDPAGYASYQETLTALGPLVISEAAVRNVGLNIAGSSSDCDWVEIRNVSGAPVRLSDYYLSDRHDAPLRWRLPDEELAPGAFAVYVCEQPGSGFYGTTPCTGFSLNSSHEQLYLSTADGELVDWASLRDIPLGASYGRMDGEAGFYYFASPTPGRANGNGCRRVSAAPVLLSPDGVFDGVESVTMAVSGAGELRYSFGGYTPTADSTLYTAPLEITQTCAVSVRCFEEDALPSRTLALSYILNEGHSLPVVSFVAEDAREFSGIYSAGSKLYELPGALSLYREDGGFRIGCGVTLNGETSLVMPKKNMAVHIRGAYGAASLEYDIFGGGATSFTDLLLRAGQDQSQGIIRNELAQSLAEKAGTAVINQRSIFCVLYLNGEYAGLYTLKERPNAALYASVAGVDRDSVQIYEAPIPYGSDFYEDIIRYVTYNDMGLDEHYAHFCELVDIDSLIDWFLLEGFCANTDVTMGNLRYARSPEADGKWHFLFYDLDAAFRSIYSVQTNLLNGYGAAHIQVAAFTVPLMKNASFRERYLSRAAELLRGPLSNEAVLAEIDRMAAEIRPEVARDYAKFNRDAASWERALEDLRSMIRDGDWRQANIEGLCESFELDSEARAHYFGDMDAPKKKT